MPGTPETPLWTPSPAEIERANLTRFIAQVRALGDGSESIVDFQTLHDWSIENPELFWTEVRRFFGIEAGPPDPAIACERVLIGRNRVAPPDPQLGPVWFVGT